MKGFSQRLRFLREERGMFQEQLAEKIDVTRPTLASYESGRTLPDSNVLIKICTALDCSADYLLGFSPFKNEKDYCQWRDARDAVADALGKLPEQQQSQLANAVNRCCRTADPEPFIRLVQSFEKAVKTVKNADNFAQILEKTEAEKAKIMQNTSQICMKIYNKAVTRE